MKSRKIGNLSAERELMPNGEIRLRLRLDDGTAYIRTEASALGGWQRSHYHRLLQETYIVQSGRMALAEKIGSSLNIRMFSSGEIVTTARNISHNVYLFGGAVLHTVKHGEGDLNEDWYADRSFDERTTVLTEETILRLTHYSK